jgi:hypothetical protein
MKIGQSINDLVREVKRQSDSKIDYLCNTKGITVNANGEVCMRMRGKFGSDTGFLPLSKIALRQVGERTGIPAKYVDRLVKDAPDMLAVNLNHWFTNEPKKQMIRTMEKVTPEGNNKRYIRAFLSDRYRPLDNWDMLDAVLPHIQKPNITIESCDVTEGKMYIKAVDHSEDAKFEIPRDPNVSMDDIKWGKGHHLVDIIKPAITIGNSEVGLSSLYVIPGVFTMACTNLVMFKSHATRKYHVGSTSDSGHYDEYDTYGIYSDKTNRLHDSTIWSKMADLVDASLGGKVFNIMVDKLIESRKLKMTGSVEKTMDCFAERLNVTSQERSGILTHLIEGGNLSAYGLHSAVTRFSQGVDDYDRASELEEIGAEVIELTSKEWESMTVAA